MVTTPTIRPRHQPLIDFTPPPAVAEAAAKGLLLRSRFHRGGTAVGVARARDMKNRRNASPRTIMRMVSYFARHQVDKRSLDFGNDLGPSAGYIAWLLWGGDPGRAWALEIKQQLQPKTHRAYNHIL